MNFSLTEEDIEIINERIWCFTHHSKYGCVIRKYPTSVEYFKDVVERDYWPSYVLFDEDGSHKYDDSIPIEEHYKNYIEKEKEEHDDFMNRAKNPDKFAYCFMTLENARKVIDNFVIKSKLRETYRDFGFTEKQIDIALVIALRDEFQDGRFYDGEGCGYHQGKAVDYELFNFLVEKNLNN
jgi:hypothetical protein